jgi:hypothetical protein
VEAIMRAARLLREFTRATPHRSIDQLARSLRLSAGLTRRTM